jgi:uncharacterized protein YgbK (DUF1537 family)
MIAVIADDFTGAAEMAGIGLRYGLDIQLAVPGIAYSGADVFVVSTDSRSMDKEAAIRITGDVMKYILALKPEMIYKKIDSVLRGHVLDELKVQMEMQGLTKAFVLPANPSLNRTIKDGRYYIDDKKIHETGFATDPEFAITDSSVLKMIRAAGEERILKRSAALPANGVVIGEAESTEEIKEWGEVINYDWALCGAGDFFTALLNKRFTSASQPPAVLLSPHLYVSGTTFDNSREWIKQVDSESGCVVFLTPAMMQDDDSWFEKASQLLREQQKCIIAFADDVDGIAAAGLREKMAMITERIINKEKIKEIFIEGGSTAAAILKELNIVSFHPVNELRRGVVRMHAGDLYLTVKPGSYELPSQIVTLYR